MARHSTGLVEPLDGGTLKGDAQQGSISFLKKRNKKLLFSWAPRPMQRRFARKNKSFLVLFFKKELLLYCLPSPHRAQGRSLAFFISMLNPAA
jgi:hypothetical protein